MLADARAVLGGVRRVAEQLEEARLRGEPAEEPAPSELDGARGIGAEAEIRVLGVAIDLGLALDVPGRDEDGEADLLADPVVDVPLHRGWRHSKPCSMAAPA